MKSLNQNNIVLYEPILAEMDCLNLVMAYPTCESFALSSLGYMWLSKILDEHNDVKMTQVFTDSKTFPNTDCIEALAFSISYEMDFMGVFEILEKLGVEVFSEKRGNLLIFAGGPVITSNPQPFSNIFDFFLIGDGEALIKKVSEVLFSLKNSAKDEKLKALSCVEGVFVPKYPKPTKKVSEALVNCVHTPVISEKSYFSNTFIIEVERGCYNRCGFCLASYLNLPVRYVDYDEIIQKIELGLKYTQNIALLGAQVSAHPDFDKICNYVIQKIESGENINLNFSSEKSFL